ncbi:hypothetical protein CRJUMX01_750028 [Escherichia coli]|nr:hypothetical protein CRJUMX01_750028 [Escherichia coli]
MRFRGMSRTRQSKPNRSRTVASNVAAVVDRAVVAVNSNHAVRKVVRSLVTRSPQKNRLVVSAMPNRQANNNVAAVRVNLPLRSNLLCRAMPGIFAINLFLPQFYLGQFTIKVLQFIINCAIFNYKLHAVYKEVSALWHQKRSITQPYINWLNLA